MKDLNYFKFKLFQCYLINHQMYFKIFIIKQMTYFNNYDLKYEMNVFTNYMEYYY